MCFAFSFYFKHSRSCTKSMCPLKFGETGTISKLISFADQLNSNGLLSINGTKLGRKCLFNCFRWHCVLHMWATALPVADQIAACKRKKTKLLKLSLKFECLFESHVGQTLLAMIMLNSISHRLIRVDFHVLSYCYSPAPIEFIKWGLYGELKTLKPKIDRGKFGPPKASLVQWNNFNTASLRSSLTTPSSLF